MKKIEGGKISPPIHPPIHAIKHFQDFRNADFPTKNEDAQYPFWNT